MSDMLDRWEKEAVAYTQKFHYKNFAPGGTVARTAELTGQVLALISLVRNKDEKFKIISRFQYEKDLIQLTAQWGAMIMIAKDGLELTDQLGGSDG